MTRQNRHGRRIRTGQQIPVAAILGRSPRDQDQDDEQQRGEDEHRPLPRISTDPENS